MGIITIIKDLCVIRNKCIHRHFLQDMPDSAEKYSLFSKLVLCFNLSGGFFNPLLVLKNPSDPKSKIAAPTFHSVYQVWYL